MRYQLLAASIALLISQTTLANHHAIPTTCPNIGALKNTGVSSAMRDQNGSWITLEWKNHFDTEHEWTFGVGKIIANDQSDALAKGNAAISGLVYKYGPVKMGSDQEPMWICVYEASNSEILGATFNPALTPEVSQFVNFFHRK